MSGGYSLLPLPTGIPAVARSRLSRPSCALTLLAFLLFFGLTSTFRDRLVQYAHSEPAAWSSDAQNFNGVFLKEAALPQHNRTAGYPEGQNGRLVQFSNQVRGRGWNNLLHERILNTILAYESNRAPVFSPFEAWAHPPRDDHIAGPIRQVLKIPYSALLSGPTAGAPWGTSDHHPRAVSQEWWEHVCPRSRRKVIDATKFMKKIGGSNMDGKELMHWWSTMLKDLPDSCVELTGTQVFDFLLIGSTRLLSLWPLLSTHPAVENLRDSEIVLHALSHNLLKLKRRDLTESTQGDRQVIDTIPGLVAIHIRRGDFGGNAKRNKGHCRHLARWGSTFSGWSQLPQLVDKFTAPAREGDWTPDWAHDPEYMRRCLPTPLQVAERLHVIRAAHRTRLSSVFIATNAEEEYLTELRDVLVADGWDRDGIVTSKELELNWQATSVGMAVDMAVMGRAEVFVGNGFSSMSSNVIMRRLTTGKPVDTCRLW